MTLNVAGFELRSDFWDGRYYMLRLITEHIVVFIPSHAVSLYPHCLGILRG